MGLQRADRIGVALAAIHLVLAVGLGCWLSVWMDEGFTLATTGAGPAHAWRQAVEFELQPPLYFVLLSAWRLLDDSFGFARAFSALCTTGALCLLAFSGGPRRRALVCLLAVHPFMLWAASEARVYGLVLLEVVTFVVLFARSYRGAQAPRRARAGLIVVAACGIYTHYYFGFLLPAFAAALLWARDWRSLRRFCLDMLAVAVVCVPLVFSVARQIEAHHALGGGQTFLRVVTDVFWRTQQYVLPSSTAMSAHEWWDHLRSFIWGGILVAGGGVLLRRRSRLEFECLVVAAVLLGEFAALRALTPPELYAIRHTTVLFIPLFVAMFTVLAASPVRLSRAIFALLLAFALVTSWTRFSTGQKTGYFGEVARFLESHESGQQPVLVYHGDRVLPLQQHYHGVNRLVPFPQPLRLVADYEGDFVLRDATELEQAFAVLGGQTTVWLVTVGPARYLGLDFHHEVLENWVATRFVTSVDQLVGPDSRIRRLERLPM